MITKAPSPTASEKDALPSDLLKRIVGGAQHDDKQNIDSNTAVEMTAGADEAGHAPPPVPQAAPVEDKTAIETKSSHQDDGGKETADREEQSLQQALTTIFVAMKSMQATHDTLQKAGRTDTDLESGEQAHKTATDVMQQALHNFYEAQQKLTEARSTPGQTSKLGGSGPDEVEDHDATSSHGDNAGEPGAQDIPRHMAAEQAKHQALAEAKSGMHDTMQAEQDAAEKTLENLKQAAEAGDSDAVRAALSDLFEPTQERLQTEIDAAQQALQTSELASAKSDQVNDYDAPSSDAMSLRAMESWRNLDTAQMMRAVLETRQEELGTTQDRLTQRDAHHAHERFNDALRTHGNATQDAGQHPTMDQFNQLVQRYDQSMQLAARALATINGAARPNEIGDLIVGAGPGSSPIVKTFHGVSIHDREPQFNDVQDAIQKLRDGHPEDLLKAQQDIFDAMQAFNKTTALVAKITDSTKKLSRQLMQHDEPAKPSGRHDR